MAVLWSFGCDTYDNDGHFSLNNVVGNSGSGSTTNGGRFGGGTLGGFSGFSAYTNVWATAANGNRIMGGTWQQITLGGGPARLIKPCNAAASQHGAIGYTATGAMYVTQWNAAETTAIATGTNGTMDYRDSAWHWIEFDIKYDAVGWAKVWVDGVQVINYSGNMVASGTPSVQRALINPQKFADDTIFWDDTGTGMFTSSPVGPLRCQTIVPTSDAAVQWTHSTGTTNFGTVDEIYISGFDSQYNSSGTAGQADLFGLGDLSFTPSTVMLVTVNTVVNQSTSGTNTMKDQIVSGGTAYYGATFTVPYSQTLMVTQYEKNPNSGVAWTAADVNALQSGYVLVS